MRAIQVSEFGGPEVLELHEVQEPEPAGGLVPVEVSAAGINYADTHQAENSYLQPATLPLIPGAAEAVRRLGARWPLAVASSSPRRMIELVLELCGLTDAFDAVLSSEEVARGKPSPDVYLRACELLESAPARTAAIEDSGAGVRAAKAAGMPVVLIPETEFPPQQEVLESADIVLDEIAELDSPVLEALAPSD